jgi:hypothetical protein
MGRAWQVRVLGGGERARLLVAGLYFLAITAVLWLTAFAFEPELAQCAPSALIDNSSAQGAFCVQQYGDFESSSEVPPGTHAAVAFLLATAFAGLASVMVLLTAVFSNLLLLGLALIVVLVVLGVGVLYAVYLSFALGGAVEGLAVVGTFILEVGLIGAFHLYVGHRLTDEAPIAGSPVN